MLPPFICTKHGEHFHNKQIKMFNNIAIKFWKE